MYLYYYILQNVKITDKNLNKSVEKLVNKVKEQISIESGLIKIVIKQLCDTFSKKYEEINVICTKAYNYEGFNQPNEEKIVKAFSQLTQS